MSRALVVVGAGGFGRETCDVVEAINMANDAATWSLIGVVDDAPAQENLDRLRQRNIPYLGTRAALSTVEAGTNYAIGIGSPATRQVIATELGLLGLQAATLIHPTATIASEVEVGEGTIVLAGVRISTNIRIGRHVHLNPNVTVGHDTAIGDFVSINPSASVSGDCIVEAGALIGVHATVLNRLRVGANATVGGAACVVRDVPPGAVVKGVPAR